MKKGLPPIRWILVLLPFLLNAQNLQLHYETHSDRQYLNAMLESYTFDQWGGTYWFVSFNFTDPDQTGSSSLGDVYGEIARYVTLPFLPAFSYTLQYNDGVGFGGYENVYDSYQVGSIWLTGLSYALPVRQGATQVDLLARYLVRSEETQAQVTVAWFRPFGESGLEFVGYWDLWTETSADDKRVPVILTEPQLWYTVWENLDLGVGFELTYNWPSYDTGSLVHGKDTRIYPNLSTRWNF